MHNYQFYYIYRNIHIKVTSQSVNKKYNQLFFFISNTYYEDAVRYLQYKLVVITHFVPILSCFNIEKQQYKKRNANFHPSCQKSHILLTALLFTHISLLFYAWGFEKAGVKVIKDIKSAIFTIYAFISFGTCSFSNGLPNYNITKKACAKFLDEYLQWMLLK